MKYEYKLIHLRWLFYPLASIIYFSSATVYHSKYRQKVKTE